MKLKIVFRSLGTEQPNEPLTVETDAGELEKLQNAWLKSEQPGSPSVHALKAAKTEDFAKLLLRLNLIAYIQVLPD